MRMMWGRLLRQNLCGWQTRAHHKRRQSREPLAKSPSRQEQSHENTRHVGEITGVELYKGCYTPHHAILVLKRPENIITRSFVVVDKWTRSDDDSLVGEEVFHVAELIVDHESEHTHLGSPALVQFHSTLLQLGFCIKRIPTKVNRAVAEIADVFIAGAFNVFHDTEFQKANKGGNLQGTSDRDSERGIPSVAKVGKLGARVVNVTRQVNASGVDKVTNDTEHANAAVLNLHVAQAVELGLI
jgi:hypothetical protein